MSRGVMKFFFQMVRFMMVWLNMMRIYMVNFFMVRSYMMSCIMKRRLHFILGKVVEGIVNQVRIHMVFRQMEGPCGAYVP